MFLALLYLRHKLRLAKIEGDWEGVFTDGIIDFSKRFISVISMPFDLRPYLINLSTEDQDKLISEIEAEGQKLDSELTTATPEKLNYMIQKKFKTRLAYWKLRKMLKNDISGNRKEMLEEYKECVEIEEEPEQGERLIADEYIILIDEQVEDSK